MLSNKQQGAAILSSLTGGDTVKYLKAMRTLSKRGPLSDEAVETLRMIRKLEPELYQKYFENNG